MNPTQDDDARGTVDAVVVRTAEHLDVDPLELDPLGTVIEPDLVADFVASDAVIDDSELRFRFNGCDVTVTGDGDVTVETSQ